MRKPGPSLDREAFVDARSAGKTCGAGVSPAWAAGTAAPQDVLTAMFSQDKANFRALDSGDGIGAAEVSLAFVAHPRGQVAGAGAAVFDLPFGGQPETFFRPLMGLHLRHDCLPHFQ